VRCRCGVGPARDVRRTVRPPVILIPLRLTKTNIEKRLCVYDTTPTLASGPAPLHSPKHRGISLLLSCKGYVELGAAGAAWPALGSVAGISGTEDKNNMCIELNGSVAYLSVHPSSKKSSKGAILPPGSLPVTLGSTLAGQVTAP